MRKIWIAVIFLTFSVVGSILVLNRQNESLVRHSEPRSETVSFRDNQSHRTDSRAVSALTAGDWALFSRILDESSGASRDALLSQVIFFLDTQNPKAEAPWAVIEKILQKLEGGASAKSIVLIGKICSKFNPTLDQKKIISKFFEPHLRRYPSAWIEASVGWIPLPRSTEKLISEYGGSGRNDLYSDFKFFLPRIKDADAYQRIRRLERKKELK
jgi:hypothetical protein